MNYIERFAERLINSYVRYEETKLSKKRMEERRLFLEEKKKIGLAEEERLHPTDSRTLALGISDYISNVEILETIPRVDEYGKNYTEYHQRVTYIDDSSKDFVINVTLSGVPIPDNWKEEQKIRQLKKRHVMMKN